jgi:hypothetical protein
MYPTRGIDGARSVSSMDDVLDTVEVRRRRFALEEYYRMAEVGIRGPEDRVELIEGEIIQMSPIGPRHATCVTVRNMNALRRRSPRAWPPSSRHKLPDSDAGGLKSRCHTRGDHAAERVVDINAFRALAPFPAPPFPGHQAQPRTPVSGMLGARPAAVKRQMNRV